MFIIMVSNIFDSVKQNCVTGLLFDVGAVLTMIWRKVNFVFVTLDSIFWDM